MCIWREAANPALSRVVRAGSEGKKGLKQKMAEANARDCICLSPSATRSQASPTDTRRREARLKIGCSLAGRGRRHAHDACLDLTADGHASPLTSQAV